MISSLSDKAGLKGAAVALTGRLITIERRKAYSLIESAGGRITPGVTRRTSHLVVGMGGWPLLRDGAVGQKLLRAEQLNARGAHIQILSERRFREWLGLDRDERTEKSLPAERICELLDIDNAALARWEQLSLVSSSDGKFDFQDVVALREIIKLVGAGVRPEVIAKSLHDLARILPGTRRPLAQLRIVAEQGAELLADVEGALVDRSGQMRLDFGAGLGGGDMDDQSTRAMQARSIVPAAAHVCEVDSPRAWFDRGVGAEEDGEIESAVDYYTRAVGMDEAYAEAWFNLGAALRELGRVPEAVGAYEKAVEADPAMAEAWYNLADAREQVGRLHGAIEALLRAIGARSDYADAHFNLAHCYEAVGQRQLAAEEWREYVRLDPSGAWADLARRRLVLLEARSG
ncbi:MAG: tetratricopeptide repeat protein [Phycisphaerales bacterium]|nr:tetratricopeptide repeat protein [Phycisphaerales bacterium]